MGIGVGQGPVGRGNGVIQGADLNLDSILVRSQSLIETVDCLRMPGVKIDLLAQNDDRTRAHPDTRVFTLCITETTLQGEPSPQFIPLGVAHQDARLLHTPEGVKLLLERPRTPSDSESVRVLGISVTPSPSAEEESILYTSLLIKAEHGLFIAASEPGGARSLRDAQAVLKYELRSASNPNFIVQLNAEHFEKISCAAAVDVRLISFRGGVSGVLFEQRDGYSRVVRSTLSMFTSNGAKLEYIVGPGQIGASDPKEGLQVPGFVEISGQNDVRCSLLDAAGNVSSHRLSLAHSEIARLLAGHDAGLIPFHLSGETNVARSSTGSAYALVSIGSSTLRHHYPGLPNAILFGPEGKDLQSVFCPDVNESDPSLMENPVQLIEGLDGRAYLLTQRGYYSEKFALIDLEVGKKAVFQMKPPAIDHCNVRCEVDGVSAEGKVIIKTSIVERRRDGFGHEEVSVQERDLDWQQPVS